MAAIVAIAKPLRETAIRALYGKRPLPEISSAPSPVPSTDVYVINNGISLHKGANIVLQGGNGETCIARVEGLVPALTKGKVRFLRS